MHLRQYGWNIHTVHPYKLACAYLNNTKDTESVAFPFGVCDLLSNRRRSYQAPNRVLSLGRPLSRDNVRLGRFALYLSFTWLTARPLRIFRPSPPPLPSPKYVCLLVRELASAPRKVFFFALSRYMPFHSWVTPSVVRAYPESFFPYQESWTPESWTPAPSCVKYDWILWVFIRMRGGGCSSYTSLVSGFGTLVSPININCSSVVPSTSRSF